MRVIILTLIMLSMSGCVSSFKLMTPNGEPEVYSRGSRQKCQKLYDGYTAEGSYSVYGPPCQVEIWRKQNEIKPDINPKSVVH